MRCPPGSSVSAGLGIFRNFRPVPPLPTFRPPGAPSVVSKAGVLNHEVFSQARAEMVMCLSASVCGFASLSLLLPLSRRLPRWAVLREFYYTAAWHFDTNPWEPAVCGREKLHIIDVMQIPANTTQRVAEEHSSRAHIISWAFMRACPVWKVINCVLMTYTL